MKTVGLCTHFTATDDWAFAYALDLARSRGLTLIICHWLESPFLMRRDIVYSDLFDHQTTTPVTPALLNKLELALREYYDSKLGNFTDVGFKLCPGSYQVELVRCFRQHLLDIVVIGYQPPPLAPSSSAEKSLEAFCVELPYPALIVGRDGPDSLLLNQAAMQLRDQLGVPGMRLEALDSLLELA